MKSEHDQSRQAAVDLYRWHQDRLREMEAQAEELLEEGSFTLRERILKDVDRQRSRLEGMRDMAAALGFSKVALLKAAKAARSGA